MMVRHGVCDSALMPVPMSLAGLSLQYAWQLTAVICVMICVLMADLFGGASM